MSASDTEVVVAPRTGAWLAGTAAFLVAWVLVYSQLQPFADWLVGLLPLEPGSHLADAVAFFVYDTPKVLMLLTLVVFAHGRACAASSRRSAPGRLLAGRREGIGNVAAAALGIVTPVLLVLGRAAVHRLRLAPACRSASPSRS